MDEPAVINQESDAEVDYEEENSDDNEQVSDSEDDDDDDSQVETMNAAWEDEDDKRLKISLSATNITKKLRNDVDEDIVDGVEYARRLRKQ